MSRTNRTNARCPASSTSSSTRTSGFTRSSSRSTSTSPTRKSASFSTRSSGRTGGSSSPPPGTTSATVVGTPRTSCRTSASRPCKTARAVSRSLGGARRPPPGDHRSLRRRCPLKTRNRTVTQGQDQQVIAGVRKDLQGMPVLYLGGRTFTPATLEDYVQLRIAAATSVLVAKAAWLKAIGDYERIDADASVVIRDLKRFIVSSFGDDSAKLADFGFGWSLRCRGPRRRKRRRSPSAPPPASPATRWDTRRSSASRPPTRATRSSSTETPRGTFDRDAIRHRAGRPRTQHLPQSNKGEYGHKNQNEHARQRSAGHHWDPEGPQHHVEPPPGRRDIHSPTLVALVQSRIDAGNQVVVAKANWQNAAKTYATINTKATIVVHDLKQLVIGAFGATSSKLADFGFAARKVTVLTPEQKVAAARNGRPRGRPGTPSVRRRSSPSPERSHRPRP